MFEEIYQKIPSWKSLLFFFLLFSFIYLYHQYSNLLLFYFPKISYLYTLFYILGAIILFVIMYMPKIFDQMKEYSSSEDLSFYIKHKFIYPTPSLSTSLPSISKKKKKKWSEMDST